MYIERFFFSSRQSKPAIMRHFAYLKKLRMINLMNQSGIMLCMDKLYLFFFWTSIDYYCNCKTASVIGISKAVQVGDHLISLPRKLINKWEPPSLLPLPHSHRQPAGAPLLSLPAVFGMRGPTSGCAPVLPAAASTTGKHFSSSPVTADKETVPV